MKESSIDSSRCLCPYCSNTFETAEELRGHVFAEHKGQPLPAPNGLIKLMVNGDAYEFQVKPTWTLYYLLHDKMGLIGTKMFCDRGACGSCTVIMEGRPILSCMTLAIECDGKTIETIEGIAGANHPLIDAYVKHHCMQCGYCTPGFVVTAKALLDRNPSPTEDDVKEFLAGNLCRCGTYPQHLKAVLEAVENL